jgi:hypothetical protein
VINVERKSLSINISVKIAERSKWESIKWKPGGCKVDNGSTILYNISMGFIYFSLDYFNINIMDTRR